MGRRKRLGSDEPPSLVTSTRSSFASSPHPRLDPRWLGSTLDISLEHEIARPRWEDSMVGQGFECIMYSCPRTHSSPWTFTLLTPYTCLFQ